MRKFNAIATRTWMCDDCGKPVTAEDGYLEWLMDSKTSRTRGFRLVHKDINCSAYHRRPVPPDTHDQHMALSDAVGEDGLVRMISLLHPGMRHREDPQWVEIEDFGSFAELLRRLFVPNYEEALPKMDTVDPNEWPSDSNEYAVFSQETLKDLIQDRYGRAE